MQPVRLAFAVFFVCGAACQSASEPPLVEFGPAPVVGKWQAAPEPGTPSKTSPLTAAGGEVPPPTAAGQLPEAPPPPVVAAAGQPAPQLRAAGTSAPPKFNGAAGAAGAAGMGTALAGAPAVSGGVHSVSFDVLTMSQGGRYQPRNIGAIWIADASGKLIKSLKVWSRIRQRYLTKYNAARGGMAIDVTAGATLNSHQMHHVTWDLKDRAGAAAPPGKYSVVIEVTDKDATGVPAQFDFDTSVGPSMLTPASTPQYSMLKLLLSE
jgi:hypothetical protein